MSPDRRHQKNLRFEKKHTLAVSDVTPDKNARLASFGAEILIFYSNVVEALLSNKDASYKSKNSYFGNFSSCWL